MCVLISVRILSEMSLIRRIIQPIIFTNTNKSSCKVRFILVSFLWNLHFLGKISKKKIHKQNFMNIRPLGDELFHTDGQTKMKNLIFVFLNFAKAPKNEREDPNFDV